MNTFPKQKVSYKEKTTRDKVTGKTLAEASLDFIIDDSIDGGDREGILKDYRAVEGDYDEADYNYVLNPLNSTEDRYKRFGAKLRNYDIISPVINLYAGEFNQRFKNVQVLDSNPEDDNRYKEGLASLVGNYYAQKAVNELNKLGVLTGQESQDQASIQEQIEKFNSGFDSNRVITGQEVLDYIYYNEDVEDKQQNNYVDWLKCGMCVTYKGIFFNDVTYEDVNPWEINLPKNTASHFIEDADWVTRRQVWKTNQIVDRWHDKLSDTDLEWLEKEGNLDGYANNTGYVTLPTQWISNKQEYAKHSILGVTNGHEVYHGQWRSFKKVGILTFINELGQVEEMEVSEDYKIDKEHGDINIKWEWISEVWEGWRIGNESRYIYVDVRPLPYNRMELNNSSAQKLSYNGRIHRGVNGKLISIPSLGRPYQLIYNIIHYQFEKVINKNKDKVIIMPQGLFPKGINGWDEEKSMYFMNAQGMLVIDETQPTAGLALQGIKVLDTSLGAYAKESIELMQAIKAEWWEAIGMNRQRYGDSKASDGKAVTEQAIFRSAIISDELNRKFEKFQEKDFAGLLDISKLAYVEGKKGKYVNSDGREAFLRVNPDDAIHHLESDYNVHVLNSRRENENIQTAKEYGFSLGQNAEAGQMMELIGSRNFEKTKRIILKMDAINKRREEAMQQSQQESAERIEQSKAATAEADRQVEIYKADKDYDKVIDKVLLENGNDQTPDNNDNGETIRMNNHKIEQDKANLELDKKEFGRKNKETNAKIKHMKTPVTKS